MKEKLKVLIDSQLDEYNITYTVINFANNSRVEFDIDGETIAIYSFYPYRPYIDSFFDRSFFWFVDMLTEEDQLLTSRYFLNKYLPPSSPDFPKEPHRGWTISNVKFEGLTDLQ